MKQVLDKIKKNLEAKINEIDESKKELALEFEKRQLGRKVELLKKKEQENKLN